MIYALRQVSKHLKNGTAKWRKVARKESQSWGEKPLRLFALLSVLCGFKIPWLTRFVPPGMLLPNFFNPINLSTKSTNLLTPHSSSYFHPYRL